jgi:hypothetical protein
LRPPVGTEHAYNFGGDNRRLCRPWAPASQMRQFAELIATLAGEQPCTSSRTSPAWSLSTRNVI